MPNSMKPVRTRFAPSPTGYLHIGGARTALFSWAYARRHGGTFVLRIEDTDVARSTPEAVQAILDGMQWLGLEHDEGPFYQMQRMDRYKEVIQQMLASGHAYHCYTSKEELDALRAEQEAQKIKPRYDGRWRPEDGKTLPTPPADAAPVIRFKNPKDGVVAWDDQVKGRIEIANGELDDPILRAKMAEFDVDVFAFRAMGERFMDMWKTGRAHPASSNMMKYSGTELNKRSYELVMSGSGSEGLEWESDESRNGASARTWLRTKANSIEGGTSEVMLNVISKRILEPPGG